MGDTIVLYSGTNWRMELFWREMGQAVAVSDRGIEVTDISGSGLS